MTFSGCTYKYRHIKFGPNSCVVKNWSQLGLDLMEIGVGVKADGITKLGKSKQNIM